MTATRAPERDVLTATADLVTAALARLGLDGFLVDPDRVKGGRNDNVVGAVTDGRTVFVKRLQGATEDAGARFARLDAFQQLIAGLASEHLVTPQFLGADPGSHVLAYACLPDAVPGNELAEDGRFDVALCRRAGRAVAALHTLDAPVGEETSTRSGSRLADSLQALTVEAYVNSSGAELEAWALLQHDRQLLEGLQVLATASAAAPRVPCHGDLRLDQFLLQDDVLYLTDWEEYRLADAAHDVGGFVGEFLRTAVSRMFVDVEADDTTPPGEVHAALMRRGDAELASVRPHIGAFWAGYREVRGDVTPVDPGFTDRVVAFAGWHLFDRLLAGCMLSAKLTHVERGTAGVGRNALLTPAKFAATIGLVDVDAAADDTGAVR
ncbi:class V lanthionine synthetase subunit LxmK [Jatrophihabitans sp. YIM 134969]